MSISVIVPVLNVESDDFKPWLSDLVAHLLPNDELILVDGGSTDNTLALMRTWLADLPPSDSKGVRIVLSQKGRALQMNAGALQASDDSPQRLFWFLHSDSKVSPKHFEYLRALCTDVRWGRFDVRLSGETWPYRIIEKLMNWRSRFTRVMTGDQGIYIRQRVFREINGYAVIPLMEDIEISKRLRALYQPHCDGPILQTCARRWQQDGLRKTIMLMWRLRFQYWRGVSPDELVKEYYGS